MSDNTIEILFIVLMYYLFTPSPKPPPPESHIYTRPNISCDR